MVNEGRWYIRKISLNYKWNKAYKKYVLNFKRRNVIVKT